jgi:pimeloyl-ACP methyl ester carboxylesterase
MNATVETIRFPGRPGITLVGSLHRPEVATPGGFGVIVSHGMLSDRTSAKHVAIATRAAALGRPSLRFDFAGRGESEGGPENLTLGGEVLDCRGAMRALAVRGVRHPVLVGSSLGGTVSLLAAAAEEDVAALVTIAAPSRLPEGPRTSWGESAREVPSSFYVEARGHDLEAAAARIRCPWLIIHGAEDEVVPMDHGRHLAAMGRGRLVIRQGGDHRFAAASDLAWLVDTVAAFIGRA